MATANDVLNVARGEIGYSRWTDPNPGTKYGRWYAESHGSYYGTSGVPYCAMFVSWVFNQAGQSCPGLPGAYCPWILRDGKNAGIAVNKTSAQAGDIVLFDWGKDGVPDHVGIVERNNGSYLTTIEGNTSSGVKGSQSNGGVVARRTRSFNVVCGILRPPYGGGSNPAPAPTPAPQPASSGLDVDGYGGPATIRALQKAMGTSQDGVLSGQARSNKAYLGNIWSVQWGRGGSDCVRALQRNLGISADGYWGRQTSIAYQRHLGVNADGYFGPASTKAMQRALNNGSW